MYLAFVGGIHGAGKTSLCREVAPLLGALHVTAGSLIREITGRAPSNTKAVATPEADQEALLWGLAALKGETALILDGHFCLLTATGAITPIDIGVFRRIGPDVLVVVTADPAAVTTRLSVRDGATYDAQTISALQAAELAHAEVVGSVLGIPLVRHESGSDISRLASDLQAGKATG